MAAVIKSQDDALWPMPKFRFEVDFGTNLKGILFQEVSGMDTENQIIEYRKSNSPFFSIGKMPGVKKYGNVTMKKGVFLNDNAFQDWCKQITMGNIKKETVLIKLLDENGKVTMQWTLINAWLTKITGTDLKDDGNEATVDTIEIAHEQLIISND